MTQAPTMRRVAPPREFEEALDRLTASEPGRPYPLFETKQKVLMFAAALGFHRGKRTPLDRKGTAIRFDVFEKQLDDGFFDALAVAHANDLSVLSDERSDERIQIFEEFAHTGLREIIESCFHAQGDPLTHLLTLVDDARAPRQEELAGMDPSVLRGLMGV